MASRSLGTLTLDLIAKIGGFINGMNEAERAAEKSAKKIAAAIKSVEIAGYAVGNALGQYLKQGIDLAVNAFPELIEQAAQFADIADKTGGSAEGFAAFAVSAKVAGVEIGAIADASTKLSKNLVGVDDESKAAGAALKALGINIADFKKLSPDEQIKKVAESFGGFAEGAGKAAVAQQLLGKSGAELLKFFKDYIDNGGDVNILTGEMIQKADDFADAQTRLRTEIGLYASALATNFIEPTQALVKVLKDAINETYNVSTAATAVGANSGVKQFAEDAGRALATAIDYVKASVKEFQVLTDFVGTGVERLKRLAVFDFSGAADVTKAFQDRNDLDAFFRKKPAEEGGKKTAQTFAQAYDAEIVRMRNERNRALLNASNYGAAKDNRPTLAATAPRAAGGGGDDPTKKLLENELKAFQAAGEQAKELLADRNKILDLYNAQGLLSVKAYYEALQGNIDEATAAQIRSYDQQIEALEKFRAAASKQTDVADATGKINKLQEDKAKLYRAAGNEALAMQLKEEAAAQSTRDAFDELNAKILEYQGNLRGAAAIRFDASNEKLLNQAKAEGNELAKQQLATLREYTLAQTEINALQQKFSLVQGDLQIAEERITIARDRGMMGEIESLKASGEARRKAVDLLKEQLAVYEQINAALRTPEQVQAIERLRVQLEGLSATIDPLADKFNTMFSDAAGSAFADFINGTKTAKEAFKSFTDTIFRELTNLIVKDLFKQLFSGGGQATGGVGFNFGSLLSSLFGGGAGAAPSFDTGGFTGYGSPSQPAGIVHKGEYVLNAKETAAIGVGNLSSGNFGGGGISIYQTFAPGTSRQTTDQAAQQAGRAIERARRNS